MLMGSVITQLAVRLSVVVMSGHGHIDIDGQRTNHCSAGGEGGSQGEASSKTGMDRWRRWQRHGAAGSERAGIIWKLEVSKEISGPRR